METGVPAYFTSDTPGTAATAANTVHFNDYTDAYGYGGVYKIERIRGADGAPIRNPTEDRPQKDGGISHPFYRGGKLVTIEGRIIGNTPDTRQAMEDRLRQVTQQTLRSDGAFVWSPSGYNDRCIISRLCEPVEIDDENPAIKSFTMTIYSEYAYARDVEGTIIILGPADTATFHNAGNAPYFPSCEVHGPLTTFTFDNHTPDPDTPFAVASQVHYDGNGHTIGNGDYATLDMEFERLKLNSDGSSELRYIVFTDTDFFGLWPGDNSLEFNASGIGGSTLIKVYAYNGWV